jgi:hypothetical protein
MRLAIFGLGLWVGAAWGQEQVPMPGPAFDAFTQGKTLTYARDGQVWGREQYLPGRRVIWAFEGQECKRGSWYEEVGGLICFAYDGDTDAPDCWWIYADGEGLWARSRDDASGSPLAALKVTEDALSCSAPALGV